MIGIKSIEIKSCFWFKRNSPQLFCRFEILTFLFFRVFQYNQQKHIKPWFTKNSLASLGNFSESFQNAFIGQFNWKIAIFIKYECTYTVWLNVWLFLRLTAHDICHFYKIISIPRPSTSTN